MTLEERIRAAEADLFGGLGLVLDESLLPLARTGLRVRLLAHGEGSPLVLLHGVSLSAAVWGPLFGLLPGHRVLAIDLPGHGFSAGTTYRTGHVREHARLLIDDILDALELERAPILGHSLGAMFALWHAADGSERISSLVALGDPAVALPGVRVRMPLSLLALRGVGVAVLRAPSPPAVYRRLLAQGLGSAEVAAAPAPMLEALRLAARRPENARTVASLMHAIDRFRRPRRGSVLSDTELESIRTPTTFVWGEADPYLSPDDARPSIDRMPNAGLHVMPGGHGPWLVDGARTAELVQVQLSVNSSAASGT